MASDACFLENIGPLTSSRCRETSRENYRESRANPNAGLTFLKKTFRFWWWCTALLCSSHCTIIHEGVIGRKPFLHPPEICSNGCL